MAQIFPRRVFQNPFRNIQHTSFGAAQLIESITHCLYQISHIVPAVLASSCDTQGKRFIPKSPFITCNTLPRAPGSSLESVPTAQITGNSAGSRKSLVGRGEVMRHVPHEVTPHLRRKQTKSPGPCLHFLPQSFS
jgi:hypothetical protein